jgi:hypothetical protein
VTHTLRVRAIDLAGNVGAPSDPITVTVDSVAPVSQIAYPEPGASVPEACLTLPDGQVLLWGSVTDGMATETVQASVDGGQTWQAALRGADAAALLARTLCDSAKAAALDNDQSLTRLWAITLPAPYGELALRSRAVDTAGNVEALKAPRRVQHVRHERPVTQLYFPLVIVNGEPRR